MKISGDKILVLLVLGLLIGILFFIVPHFESGDKSSDVPYSTYSIHQDGTQLFYRLLNNLGFRAQRIRAMPYNLPDELQVLFLLQPLSGNTLQPELTSQIKDFVEKGNVLILAGEGKHGELDNLLEAYDLKLAQAIQPIIISKSLHPLFQYPPVEYIISLNEQVIRSTRLDIVPLFGVDRDYSVITFRAGSGRVYVLSCPYIFTNRGIGDYANAKFIHNLLTYLPQNASIGFDEYHHGFRVQTSKGRSGRELHASLSQMFLTTPIGWAFIYIGVLIFIFLILRGRRLGLPLDIGDRGAVAPRRMASEYVLSMAELYRKSGKRYAILQHIRNEFRRSMASRWDINPTLSASVFTREIAKREPIDADQLFALLKELDETKTLSEGHLLSLAQRVDNYQKRTR